MPAESRQHAADKHGYILSLPVTHHPNQPLHPGKLICEVRTARRLSVWKINVDDANASNRTFNKTRLSVRLIAGQSGAQGAMETERVALPSSPWSCSRGVVGQLPVLLDCGNLGALGAGPSRWISKASNLCSWDRFRLALMVTTPPLTSLCSPATCMWKSHLWR